MSSNFSGACQMGQPQAQSCLQLLSKLSVGQRAHHQASRTRTRSNSSGRSHSGGNPS